LGPIRRIEHMEFSKDNPKVLINFEPNNEFTKGFFVYLQDKVPFMDCVDHDQPIDGYENWVEHTQRHGTFDLYFHLIDNDHAMLDAPIYHQGYYIDTKGIEKERDNTSVIYENTYEELWDRVKDKYLNSSVNPS
jgi:hypothetical protein